MKKQIEYLKKHYNILQLNSLETLFEYKGYIALYKKGNDKALYLFNELKPETYKNLIDIITNEFKSDYIETMHNIKIYHIDLKEIDCFFNNAIETICLNEYAKNLIEENKKGYYIDLKA